MKTTNGGWIPTPYGAKLAAAGMIEPGSRSFMKAEVAAILSEDSIDRLWHLSLSHPERRPTFEEVRDAIKQLIPGGRWMVEVHPPEQFMGAFGAPRTVQLWESPNSLTSSATEATKDEP